ncbi:hypothetical protein IWW48_005444 [Coemansia sp. RSA 1200]|nr:hypothetical protein IWW48_005444 [Coemansia sp. RSA 1200]
MDRLTLASLALIVLSTLYSLHRLPAAGNRCTALLETGWWADHKALLWQPQGCTLKQYKRKDIQQCLGTKTALFVGDSAVRSKFYALARAIDPQFVPPTEKAHQDMDVAWPDSRNTDDANNHDTSNGAPAARFLWDPYLNRSDTLDMLANDAQQPLPVALVGTGLWYLRNRNTGSGGIEAWRAAINRLAGNTNVYVSPVPQVVPALLSPERRETLDPEAIRLMNEYMASQPAQLQVFGSWDRMAQLMLPAETQDGLHYSDRLEDRAVNVLLNRACNMETVAAHAPFRTTCCIAYPRPPWMVVGAALLTCGGLAALLAARMRGGLSIAGLPAVATLRQMAAFGAILLLMYVCDRTPVFDKLQKHFVAWEFWLLAGATLAVGVVTWQKNPGSNGGGGGGGFLGRQQTDEWKGWMQLLILVYHMLNASTVAGIYNPVRVLVAMYLFMTGFGHCVFFCKKADFGLRRLTAVLLRTNVLAVALAYVMGTSYMDYYFAPLSSAWFLVVWLTMRVAPHTNKSRLVWIKIIVSAAICKAANDWLHLWPFALLQRVFGVAWSQREWEFRFGTDIFIVYVGMAAAVVMMQHGAQLQAHPRWSQIQRWAVLASVAGLLWYAAFELTRADKFAYNAWHPYVSPIPVLAFVVLRNSSTYLRDRSSSAFRFVGLISLELFIAQFHLFLAADTKAVLVLSDSRLWWIVNLAPVGIVFFGMCQLLANASSAICAWLMAVRSDAKQTVPPASATGAMIPMAELSRPTAQQQQQQQQQSLEVQLHANSAGSGSEHTAVNIDADNGSNNNGQQIQIPAVLDRLASNPPIAARLFDNLAARWAVGLLLLSVVNRLY